MTSNRLPLDVTVTVEHLPDSDEEDGSSNKLTLDEHTLVMDIKVEKDNSEMSEPEGYDGDDKQSGPEAYDGDDKQSGPEAHDGDDKQSEPEAYDGDGKQSEPEPYDGDDKQSEPEAYDGDDKQSEPEAYDGDDKQSEPEAYDGDDKQSEPEAYDGDDKQSEPEAYDGDDKQSEPEAYDGDNKQSTLIEVSVDPLAFIPENPYEFHDQQEPIARRKSKRKRRTKKSVDQLSDHHVAHDFSCPICLKMLGSTKALKYHITTHREKPMCSVCNRTLLGGHTCKTRSGATDILTDKQRRKRELATERMRKYRQRKQMALVAQLAAMTEEMKREMERERLEKHERRRECARERSRKYRENKKLENTQQASEQV